MSRTVVAREAAEKMVEQWIDYFGASIRAGSKEKIVRATMAGLIDLNGDVFTQRLQSPIRLENGETINELKIKEAEVGQLREAGKGGGSDMDTALRLLSALTGQGLGIIDRIKQRDFLLASELQGFFE